MAEVRAGGLLERVLADPAASVTSPTSTTCSS